MTYCVFGVATLRPSMSDRVTSFSDVLRLRTPKSLTTAIREAADRHMTTTSEYVRQSVIQKLRVDGIDHDPRQRIEASK